MESKRSHTGSEEGLFRLIASGDEQAFARLHAAYKDRLLYYGKRFLDNWEDVADIVSDAFLKLWLARTEIKSDAHLVNFLYRTVRHRAIDRIKTDKRQHELLEQMEAPQETEEMKLETELVRVEMMHLLAEAVNTLPVQYRRVFELSYDAERSPAEIARILQINPDTVRSQKRRAIEMIRKWIKEKGLILLFILFFIITPICVSKKNIHFFGTIGPFIRNNYIDT